MSDVETTPGKSNAWTDEAKLHFLMRIICQLRVDGATVNWSKISMEGRTTKSLQNQWFKMNKEINELAAENASGQKTPTQLKSTPRKPHVKKEYKKADDASVTPDAEGDNDDKIEVKTEIKAQEASNEQVEFQTPKKQRGSSTPKKRDGSARANSAKKRKLTEAKMENSDEEGHVETEKVKGTGTERQQEVRED
ncbi:hypothetical protein CDD81_2740 [Ophiocordyceps australis]|uniref:Myb-like domain-containing protein n=1 Tax=Ophiocordyceps australis TaxID=1399860 RepID=A0A2C5XK00_9HYPO|nr:hypothetical protein CDD81_2740 [Ophiocordyceps australis]